MDLLVLAPIGALCALGFAFVLAGKIMQSDEGTPQMKEVASAIRIGANAYLRRQYIGVSLFFVLMFVILSVLAFYRLLTPRIISL